MMLQKGSVPFPNSILGSHVKENQNGVGCISEALSLSKKMRVKDSGQCQDECQDYRTGFRTRVRVRC